MNILWRYVDELVGKGFTLDVLGKFFYYSSLTLVPTALPLAVLLASLITYGNLGERLELLAMKTAGISLLRIMRPLIIFCIVLAGISLYFQNVTGPNSSKKLYSLLYSMKQKSPELEIPEGVFYDQISGYNLYVKHKDLNTGTLHQVTIYDISKGFEEIRVISADSGRLETTADKRHLYLRLYSGEQFENMQAQQMNRSNNPYRRETFKEKHILIEFNSDFSEIDENVMSSQAASKNMSQIRHTIDSLSSQQDSIGMGNLSDYKASALGTFRFSNRDSAALNASLVTAINTDSVFNSSTRSRKYDWKKTMQARIQTQKSELSLKGISMFQGDRTIRRHWIEWMKKISLSTSILIFFFIGAPLGAIIRKGGLGIPVIISVLTFILYYITSVSGEKMYREGEWSIIGCWLSSLVLLPLSLFFTVKANRDSVVFQIDVYKNFFHYWFGGKSVRDLTLKEIIIDKIDPADSVKKLKSLITLSTLYLNDEKNSRSIDYFHLFFSNRHNSDLKKINMILEDVVEELGNSRDRVVPELLNTFPTLAVHGIEKPFSKDWANRLAGVFFPLGILLFARAILFNAVLKKDLRTIIKSSDSLINYLEIGITDN